MRLKNPFTYIGTKNRKNSHPKRKIFQKNLRAAKKQLSGSRYSVISSAISGKQTTFPPPPAAPAGHRRYIAPIAAARCMSTAPTTASAFLNTPAHSTSKFLAERFARPSTVSMKMRYCPLFPKCPKPLQSMQSMTEPSLSEWYRKCSPASRQQRLRNSAHALLPPDRGLPGWKSCSVKSMRTTF